MFVINLKKMIQSYIQKGMIYNGHNPRINGRRGPGNTGTRKWGILRIERNIWGYKKKFMNNYRKACNRSLSQSHTHSPPVSLGHPHAPSACACLWDVHKNTCETKKHFIGPRTDKFYLKEVITGSSLGKSWDMVRGWLDQLGIAPLNCNAKSLSKP